MKIEGVNIEEHGSWSGRIDKTHTNASCQDFQKWKDNSTMFKVALREVGAVLRLARDGWSPLTDGAQVKYANGNDTTHARL